MDSKVLISSSRPRIMDSDIDLKDTLQLPVATTSKTSKRYSFSFNGFTKRSSIGASHPKRSISISGPSLLSEQQLLELPSVLTASIYQNQVYPTEKRNSSYALCQSLEQSLIQSSTNVPLSNGEIVTVPSLVVKCCQFILSRELLEGLFRVNSSVKKIKQLETLINSKLEQHQDFSFEDFVSMDTEVDEVNSYDVSMILKRYLNNLNAYLVDRNNYSKFLKNHEKLKTETSLSSSPSSTSPLNTLSSPSSHHSVASASNSQFSNESTSSSSTTCTDNNVLVSDQLKDVEKVLKKDAIDILQNISTSKLHLLLYLLQFLHEITRSEELVAITKMSSLNLSKMFQPSLFEFKVESMSSTENLLDFYKNNESILWRWIENFDFLSDALKKEKANFIQHLVPDEEGQNNSDEKQLISSALEAELIPNVIPQEPARPTMDTLKSDDTIKPIPQVDYGKKQKRRSLFGYRSVSSPLPSPSAEPVATTTNSSSPTAISPKIPKFMSLIDGDYGATHGMSRLKRLPTTIFGSSYSLKTKLGSSHAANPSPKSHTSPATELSNDNTKQRRRLTVYGFEHLLHKRDQLSHSFKESQEETEEDLTPTSVSSGYGLQKRPIVAQDMKFNQSPRSSPLLEQSGTFGEKEDVSTTTSKFHKPRLSTSTSKQFLKSFLQQNTAS